MAQSRVLKSVVRKDVGTLLRPGVAVSVQAAANPEMIRWLFLEALFYFVILMPRKNCPLTMIVRREFEFYGPELGEELRLRLRKDWEHSAVGKFS